jgi:AcrR family transcriptional regulator
MASTAHAASGSPAGEAGEADEAAAPVWSTLRSASTAGSQRLAINNWRSTTGDQQLAINNWRSTTGDQRSSLRSLIVSRSTIASRAAFGYAAAVEPAKQPDHGEMPALPWQKPRRRRPVKEPLTRERIVAAAIAILDRDGLDAVSTRRVAEDLGTGSASLYAHVASRDELLELMVDRIAGEIEVPEPDPARWQDQLRTYARHAQRVWSRHADITRASLAFMPTGPNRLRVIEGLLAILRAAGFSDQLAAWAVDRLLIYIDADVYEGALYAAKIKQGLEMEEYLESIRDYFRRLPADRFPLIASMADSLIADSDQRFEFGVELLIDGLTARLQAGR